MVAFANEKPMPLFDLGRIVATPGALEVLRKAGVVGASLLVRHQKGDYGNVSADDRKANDDAVKHGARIMSVYPLGKGETIWIITEAVGDDGKRACTTLLLPHEY